MKLKRSDVLEIYEVLDSFKDDFDKEFMYYVSKLSKSLEDERNAIIEVGRPSDEYLKYENQRKEIINKYCEKDSSGNSIEVKENGKIGVKIIPEQKENLREELNNLYNSNKEIVNKGKEAILKFIDFLKEETEVNLVKIPFKYIPQTINKEKMDVLLSIIEEINE